MQLRSLRLKERLGNLPKVTRWEEVKLDLHPGLCDTPSAVDEVDLSLQQPHEGGRESSEQAQLWDENPELRAVMRRPRL